MARHPRCPHPCPDCHSAHLCPPQNSRSHGTLHECTEPVHGLLCWGNKVSSIQELVNNLRLDRPRANWRVPLTKISACPKSRKHRQNQNTQKTVLSACELPGFNLEVQGLMPDSTTDSEQGTKCPHVPASPSENGSHKSPFSSQTVVRIKQANRGSTLRRAPCLELGVCTSHQLSFAETHKCICSTGMYWNYLVRAWLEVNCQCFWRPRLSRLFYRPQCLGRLYLLQNGICFLPGLWGSPLWAPWLWMSGTFWGVIPICGGGGSDDSCRVVSLFS